MNKCTIRREHIRAVLARVKVNVPVNRINITNARTRRTRYCCRKCRKIFKKNSAVQRRQDKGDTTRDRKPYVSQPTVPPHPRGTALPAANKSSHSSGEASSPCTTFRAARKYPQLVRGRAAPSPTESFTIKSSDEGSRL